MVEAQEQSPDDLADPAEIIEGDDDHWRANEAPRSAPGPCRLRHAVTQFNLSIYCMEVRWVK